MGGQALDPPSRRKRGDDPTKEASKSSHSGGSVRSITPWGGTQDCLVLSLDAGGSVGLLVGKNLPEEKLESQTLNMRHSQCFHSAFMVV